MQHSKHQKYANVSPQEELTVLFQSITGKGQQRSNLIENN